jgi:hypothetical protein
MNLEAGSAPGKVAAAADFFTMSECRDLLFHVQEHRHRLPEIARFIDDIDLQFLGFEFRIERRQSSPLPGAVPVRSGRDQSGFLAHFRECQSGQFSWHVPILGAKESVVDRSGRRTSPVPRAPESFPQQACVASCR